LLVDRFSDGREAGYRDVDGVEVAGETPPYSPADGDNAIGTDDRAAEWREAGGTWAGGTLAGVRSSLGYIKRLGVTALWISPVLRQRPNTNDYHGYGIQNFLEVDPNFGSADDLRDLVREAHALNIYVILDVVFHRTELQSMSTFTRRGRISGWDNDPEYREGDFFGYKKRCPSRRGPD
jgi:glycosidase